MMFENFSSILGHKTRAHDNQFIAIDRDAILATEGSQKYELLANLAACDCIRDDVVGVDVHNQIIKNAIVISKEKLYSELPERRREAILRVLKKFSAIMENISYFTSDIPLPIAVELEMRKTAAEKNSRAYKKAGTEAA
ncbi:hypothetical protein [Litoreibacter roseus]|uniref:Uncharacterized protein n=1 Tax=Litoreibacter roseus TaxID=2601869 RepID=A0A6N6JMT4_9RHOB|nr:hypothetical protein [Litoreibacter roseus]GFE67240.1 hypothetical protein KIN_43140 [Litoreibacter roseus]